MLHVRTTQALCEPVDCSAASDQLERAARALVEVHLASILLAFALHLIDQDAKHVEICPDGEHGKRFDIRSWLEAEGFSKASSHGTTYCGEYERAPHKVTVRALAGNGDVKATVGGRLIVAECKGGIINTTHAGQKSKQRRALQEAVGQLLCRPDGDERQIAVIPDTAESRRWADRIAPRARKIGIEIALVDRQGAVQYVRAD